MVSESIVFYGMIFGFSNHHIFVGEIVVRGTFGFFR